jgi:peptide deformylase
MDAEGLLSIVLQHEIDHLNGTLFIEHISSLKRQMYKRRIKKQLKNQ